MTELILRGLTKRYGATPALEDFNLVVPSASRTAIVGPSGSGKTTLLRLIAGFEAPDAGEILLGGEVIADASAALPTHRRNIGLVMQEGALFPHLSVLDNIRFGLPRSGEANRALELLDLVGLDRGMAARAPHQLSGGQQQRVALARAMARKPRVMLLDEPFSALDAGLREQLRDAVVRILAEAGIAAILVTHDRDEAMGFATQLVVLREGRLMQSGQPGDLYRAPVDPVTATFLGEAIILDAVVTDGIGTCALGALPIANPAADGPARIMLRPEQIAITPAKPGQPATATVLSVEELGPLRRVAVRIDGAETLTFRTCSSVPHIGSRVHLMVAQPAVLFESI